ncbi:NAD(P)H-dependent oxidoreductase [Candidatus Woesearchaeota archaeon]|nr:NAD(P)H-dependent oxidoreductase [Candidatus Woesearchaeota archaeon]
MEFKQIVMQRYATKLFDGRKLPESKVNELMEMIRYSASSFNIQPWVIKIVTNPAVKEELSSFSWNQPQVKSCSHLLVFCANKDIAGNIDKLEKLMIKSGAKTNDIKDYIKMMEDFDKSLSEEQKLAWAQRQTYLALGNAINGAKALGFDSCPMEGFEPQGYSKVLGLLPNLIPTALCPIGYASDKPNPKIRFPREEMLA